MNYIGCSGWYYQHWHDKFYKGIKKNAWFKHYCEVFNTVEINSSFYRFPKKSTIETWHQQVSTNFLFSMKAHRGITHMRKFIGAKKQIKNFYNLIADLKKNLGCVLFQMPPYYAYSEKKLQQIIKGLDLRFKNVVEFRHASWWNDQVFNAFKKHGIIFCNVSAEDFPDDIKVTAPDVYLRFHGLTGHGYNYPKNKLKAYVKILRKKKIKNIWCYFNNDVGCHAVNNALQFRKLIEQS